MLIVAWLRNLKFNLNIKKQNKAIKQRHLKIFRLRSWLLNSKEQKWTFRANSSNIRIKLLVIANTTIIIPEAK